MITLNYRTIVSEATNGHQYNIDFKKRQKSAASHADAASNRHKRLLAGSPKTEGATFRILVKRLPLQSPTEKRADQTG